MGEVRNDGIISTKGNGLDGTHIGQGGSLINNGKLIADDNTRHGLFIAGDAAAIRRNVDEIEDILSANSLANLKESLAPILVDIKTQLEKEKPDKSFLATSYSTMKDLAAKATGTAVGHTLISLIQQGVELL